MAAADVRGRHDSPLGAAWERVEILEQAIRTASSEIHTLIAGHDGPGDHRLRRLAERIEGVLSDLSDATGVYRVPPAAPEEAC